MRRTPYNRERIDIAVYPQALFLVFRNPIIILGPLLTAVLSSAVSMLGNYLQDNFGIAALLALTLDAFGLALATIVADMVWRRGNTSFDEAWEQTRSKARDIFLASLALSMALYVATYIGGIVGPFGALALGIIAAVVFIYTIAACTIGGVPGQLSLQASLDLAQKRPFNTILLAIMCFAVFLGIGIILPSVFIDGRGALSKIATALFQAIALAYGGTIISKRYADISFRNM
jgi:hypothetical protein